MFELWWKVQVHEFSNWVRVLGLSTLVLAVLSGLLCWCGISLRHSMSQGSDKWKRNAIVFSCLVMLWVFVAAFGVSSTLSYVITMAGPK